MSPSRTTKSDRRKILYGLAGRRIDDLDVDQREIDIYAKRRVRSLCKSARAENQNPGWNRPQATPARSEPPFHRSVSLPSAPPPGGCSEPSRRDK